MTFEIIPAIDILDGKCVRLTQGKYNKKIVYAEDPFKVAEKFARHPIPRLHIVDLNGAKEGYPVNFEIIAKIAESISVPIQVGGGVRSLETVDKLLEAGVDRVILGTIALQDQELIKMCVQKYKDKILISVDAQKGLMAIKGWTEISTMKATDFCKTLIELGVSRIIYTDIQRDGTLTGPNIEGLKKILKAVDIPVIASGGVSSLADIAKLKKLIPEGLEGCIIGKALYSGDIKLDEALN